MAREKRVLSRQAEATREMAKDECGECGAPFTQGCECHPGNLRPRSYEDPRAFNHVSETPEQE